MKQWCKEILLVGFTNKVRGISVLLFHRIGSWSELLIVHRAFLSSFRYVIVVHWQSAQRYGIANLVNFFIALSILAPAFITISLQYPVGEFIHGPFHVCNGRFEVYFDPTHPGKVILFLIFSAHLKLDFTLNMYFLALQYKVILNSLVKYHLRLKIFNCTYFISLL